MLPAASQPLTASPVCVCVCVCVCVDWLVGGGWYRRAGRAHLQRSPERTCRQKYRNETPYNLHQRR